MSRQNRWLIAAGVIVADLLIFMVPVIPLAAAYVLLLRPRWFKAFVDDLYEEE